jgi:hypothetical protein
LISDYDEIHANIIARENAFPGLKIPGKQE